MAFEILHVVKRPTVLTLNTSVNVNNVVAGMVAIVDSTGFLNVGGDEATGVVGVFQTQAYVPPYESTGLLSTQINGQPGSPGGGKTVSVIAGSGAIFKTDQVISAGSITPGTKLVCGAGAQLKAYDAGAGDVVGLFLGLDSTGLSIVQMRL